MKKCFIYYRVSSDGQLSGGGIERQQTLLRNYVANANILTGLDSSIPVELIDDGFSAFDGTNMEVGALGQWMRDVNRGLYNGSILVIESLDRFSRANPYDVIPHISNLVNRGIDIHDVNMRAVINRSNSSALPILMMVAERAHEESNTKSKRIRAGWKTKRNRSFENGTAVTKICPRWIDIVDNKYVLNGGEKIVRLIFELCQSGLGCMTIAKKINAMGDEWNFGHKWTKTSVSQMLRNERVMGYMLVSEKVGERNNELNPLGFNNYKKRVYPEIISEEEFVLAGKLLDSRRNVAGQHSVGRVTSSAVTNNETLVRKNILTSICRCSLCGSLMMHTATGIYRYLRCLADQGGICSNKSFRYDFIERVVLGHIKKLDISSIVKSQKRNPEIELVNTEIIELQNYINEFEDGIKKLKAVGKKPSFQMLAELDESHEQMIMLEQKLDSMRELSINTDVYKSIDIEIVSDVTNYELRSSVANELRKIIKRINFIQQDRIYMITIEYYGSDIIKHALVIQLECKKTRSYNVVCNILVESVGESIFYKTQSFTLETTADIITLDIPEKINITDYVMLLNYVDVMPEHEKIAIWMRDQFACIASGSSFY